MELNTGAPEGAAAPASVVSVPENTPADVSVSQAARILSGSRKPKDTPASPAAPIEAAPETPEESTAQADDAAPPQEATGETQETAPVEEPSRELPRSWTKDRTEHWAKLDPSLQDFLLEQDRKASAEVRRSQNEAADKLKSLTAKEQAVEQARQQYESALPLLLNNLQTAMSGEFGDIKSMADVQKLANDDWPRYIRWDAQQKQVAATQQEIQASNERQSQEKRQKFSEFAKREDELFVEKVPDMATPEKAAKLQTAAMHALKELGFSEEEMGRSWAGQADLSLRDHRVQLLIRDATLYRESQAKAKAITAKPLPPAMRPGSAPPKGAAKEAELQALNKQLDNAHGTNALRTAARLLHAKRASR